MISWADPSPTSAVESTDPGGYLSVAVVRDLGRIAVVQVSGDIDMGSAATLRTHLEDLVAAGRRFLVVDVERVTLFGADALGILAEVRRSLLPSGGSVHLVCTRQLTVRVLNITGMVHVLPVHASMPAALRAVEPLVAYDQ